MTTVNVLHERDSNRTRMGAGVVLIRFSALGDCILLCPLAERLKSCGVGEVIVVTKTQFADVFSAATAVDRVLALDPASGMGGLWNLADRLRGRGYAIIDAHATLRSRWFCLRAGRPVARFDKRYRDRLGLIILKRPAAIPTMLQQYGALAAPLGIDASDLRPGGITLPTSAQEDASSLLGSNNASWIAIAPGSRWPSKTWEVERFAELGRRLARRGYRIVVVGDTNESDAIEIVTAASGAGAVSTVGGSILKTAAVVARCETLVGNDSGLVHLAEAVGVPVVSLYGPTVESFGYYPSLKKSRTVEYELSCRPCSRNGATPCLRGTNECMSAIDVETVEAATMDLLEGGDRTRYRVARS